MWQHRSTSERLDDIERFFERLFGRPDGDAGRRKPTDAVTHHDLQQMEKRLMATLDQLKAAIERDTSVTQSVITLLTGISQQLKDLKAAQGDKIDPAALDEIITNLDANTAALGKAVTDNTPAA